MGSGDLEYAPGGDAEIVEIVVYFAQACNRDWQDS